MKSLSQAEDRRVECVFCHCSWHRPSSQHHNSDCFYLRMVDLVEDIDKQWDKVSADSRDKWEKEIDNIPSFDRTGNWNDPANRETFIDWAIFLNAYLEAEVVCEIFHDLYWATVNDIIDSLDSTDDEMEYDDV